MKREDINIRDPYVLVDDGKYYLYGTRSKTCWDLRKDLIVTLVVTLSILRGR